MKKIFFLLCLVPTLVQAELVVENAWVKNAPPVVSVRAAYLKINNTGNKIETISHISSTHFKRVEVHETRLIDGVYSMHKLDKISLEAFSSVELKPKGKHLMLMMPTEPLNMLQQIQFTIHYDNGSTVQSFAPIKDSL